MGKLKASDLTDAELRAARNAEVLSEKQRQAAAAEQEKRQQALQAIKDQANR